MAVSSANLITRVPLDRIDAEPIFQFRLGASPRSLVRSMRADGQQYPIHLQKRRDRLRVIDGHRRRLAAQALGWEDIAAVVHEIDDNESLRLAYQLNDQHRPFSRLERLNALDRLVATGMTYAQIAPIVGLRHEKSVARLRATLPLSRRYWGLLRDERLRPSHIAALRRARRDRWDGYVRRVLGESLSGRQLALIVTPRRRDLMDEMADGGFTLAFYRHDPERRDPPDEVERHAEIFDRAGARLRAWARRRRRGLRRGG